MQNTWVVALHDNLVENKNTRLCKETGIFIRQAKTAATEKMETNKNFFFPHLIGPVLSFSTSRMWCSLYMNAETTNLLFMSYISIRMKH